MPSEGRLDLGYPSKPPVVGILVRERRPDVLRTRICARDDRGALVPRHRALVEGDADGARLRGGERERSVEAVAVHVDEEEVATRGGGRGPALRCEDRDR